jgi:hypothetical protein
MFLKPRFGNNIFGNSPCVSVLGIGWFTSFLSLVFLPKYHRRIVLLLW